MSRKKNEELSRQLQNKMTAILMQFEVETGEQIMISWGFTGEADLAGGLVMSTQMPFETARKMHMASQTAIATTFMKK